MTFLPDASIFEENVFDTEILLTRLREQAFLNAGVRIILRDLRGDEAAEFDMCYQGASRALWNTSTKSARSSLCTTR